MKLLTKRNVILAVSVLILAVIGFAVYQRTGISHKGKLAISVVVAPSDSTLKVDGVKTKAGTVYVTPGKHTLSASRQYFTTVDVKIDTNTMDKKRTVYILPKPDSDEAKSYLSTHPDAQAEREAASGSDSLDSQQDISKVPLTSQLPFTAPGFEFTVDYDAEKDDSNNGQLKVTIYISANSDEARQHARDWITRQGYKISDLNIVYQADTSLSSFDNPAIGHQ
jgi:hypothetical protein